MYECLQKLEDANLLTKSVQSGVISCTLIVHKKIYEEFMFLKDGGMKTTEAVLEVSVKRNIGVSSVYDIIRKMRE